MNVKINNPRLKNINLEIKDFEYHFNEEFNAKKLDLDFNFIFKKKKTGLELFLHIRYAYLDHRENKNTIYHSDHIVQLEGESLNQEVIKLKILTLADFLGRAIIMVKGYFDGITKGYYINTVGLPVFSPLELIKVKYKDQIEDDFIVFD